MSEFNGFPREGRTFFRQLARHNNRDWFQAHKDVYERACREPMQQLVAALAAKGGGERTKVSRINRDVRFSRVKSPYRTYIAAGVGGNYVSFSPTGLYVGAGVFMPEPPALERMRKAIHGKPGAALERIVAVLRRKGYQVETHERLMSAPRGYPADHPRIELLRMKDLHAGKTFKKEAWISTPKALVHVRRAIKDLKPLADWIRSHVGR